MIESCGGMSNQEKLEAILNMNVHRDFVRVAFKQVGHSFSMADVPNDKTVRNSIVHWPFVLDEQFEKSILALFSPGIIIVVHGDFSDVEKSELTVKDVEDLSILYCRNCGISRKALCLSLDIDKSIKNERMCYSTSVLQLY